MSHELAGAYHAGFSGEKPNYDRRLIRADAQRISLGAAILDDALTDIAAIGIRETRYLSGTLFNGLRPGDAREEMVRWQKEESLKRLLASDVFENRFLIGLLLTVTPWQSLSGSLTDELQPEYSEKEASILPFFGYWGLCGSAEGKLIDSMTDRSAVLVNNALLVKATGYRTGLCIRTTSTDLGTFFQGAWYSPVGATAIEVAEAQDWGIENITVNNGEWAYMRDTTVQLSPLAARELVARASAYAQTC